MIDWNGTVPPNEPPDYELHYKNVDHGRFYIGIFATVFLLQAGILISYLGCMEKLTSVSFDWWFVVRDHVCFSSWGARARGQKDTKIIIFRTLLETRLRLEGVRDWLPATICFAFGTN